MTDTEASPPADRRERRRRLPAWAWVLIGLVVVVALVFLGFALNPAAPSLPEASPSAETPTATATPSPTASPVESTVPDLGQGTFESVMAGNLRDVLFSQDTAPLDAGGAFTDPVRVLTASDGVERQLSPTEAVQTLTELFTPLDPDPWDVSLPASTLDAYRAGPYGAYFPEGAIVARSGNGRVVSFVGYGYTITAMLVAPSEQLLF